MEKFEAYLDDIGISSPIKNRIKAIVFEYEMLIGQNIDDIFVSEYLNSEGGKELESMWLFNEHCLMEAKSFINSDDFDIAPFSNGICHLEVKKDNFDFKSVNDKSRLTVELRLKTLVSGEFKATGKNCIHLFQILKKYLLKNLNQ